MRVYLSADIEGTCGIADWAETERATMDDYRPFAAQMTAEVAAACEGAVAAGAEEIVVKDAHDSARNLDGSRLPRQARLFRGWTGDPLSMMAGLDGGQFGAVLFTGYHAWAACGGNPLGERLYHSKAPILSQSVTFGAFSSYAKSRIISSTCSPVKSSFPHRVLPPLLRRRLASK